MFASSISIDTFLNFVVLNDCHCCVSAFKIDASVDKFCHMFASVVLLCLEVVLLLISFCIL